MKIPPGRFYVRVKLLPGFFLLSINSLAALELQNPRKYTRSFAGERATRCRSED